MGSEWFVVFLFVLIVAICSLGWICHTIMAALRPIWDSFARQFPRFSHHVAGWGWAELVLAAVALEAEREYCVALFLVAAAVCSLVATCIHWQGLPEDPRFTKVIRFSGFVFAVLIFIIGSVWIWGNKGDEPCSRLHAPWEWTWIHPDMQAIIAGSASGEILDLPQPATAIALNIQVLNSGSPSITRDWALAAKLKDGEELTGVLLHKRPTFETNSTPFLDEITATSPIPNGAQAHGLLMFGFPHVHKNSIDNTDTILILSFRDVRGRKFATKYHFPAASFYAPDANSPPEELVTPHRHNTTVSVGLFAGAKPGPEIFGNVRVLKVDPQVDAPNLRLLLIARIVDNKREEQTDTSIEKSAICPLVDQIISIAVSQVFARRTKRSQVEVYVAVLPRDVTADHINNLSDVPRLGGFVGATWTLQPDVVMETKPPS